jgi:hypothetical protein
MVGITNPPLVVFDTGPERCSVFSVTKCTGTFALNIKGQCRSVDDGRTSV